MIGGTVPIPVISYSIEKPTDGSFGHLADALEPGASLNIRGIGDGPNQRGQVCGLCVCRHVADLTLTETLASSKRLKDEELALRCEEIFSVITKGS